MSIVDRLDNCKSSGFHVSCDVDVVHKRQEEIIAEHLDFTKNFSSVHNLDVNQYLSIACNTSSHRF